MKTNPVEILRDLVAIPSPSAVSNEPMVHYAAKFLEALGWKVRPHGYKDSQGTQKVNLIAVTKGGGSPIRAELALCAHTDTVPWDICWNEATQLVEQEDRLIGRGTCDMKGFIAATLSAVAEMDPKCLRKPLAIVLTADEEIGCLGATRLAEGRALEARYAIVGEPTSLQPMRAGKGYYLAETRIRGQEAHSAFPERGVSAITAGARMIMRVETMGRVLRKRRNLIFDPPYTTLNIGTIAGGRAKNIVPGECRLMVEWRPIPEVDESRIARRLMRDTERLILDFPGIEAITEVKRSDSGFVTPSRSELLKTLERISGKTSGGVAFGTEAPQFQRMGAEVVVFGPGDMREAHRTGEFIPKAELLAATEMLKRTVALICGG
jgi:acetylornithine deacetylase